MHCQRRLSFPLPLPTSSSTPLSTSLVAIDLKSVAVHKIGHLLGLGYSSVAVALDQYALGAIVVSIFALVVAIYSFITAKKKVAGEVRTEVVNCVVAVAVTTNGECRSANVANADVIIVGASVASLSNSLSLLFLFFLSWQPNSALSILFFFVFFFFLNYKKSAKVYGFASTLACYVRFVQEINMLIIEFQIQ